MALPFLPDAEIPAAFEALEKFRTLELTASSSCPKPGAFMDKPSSQITI